MLLPVGDFSQPLPYRENLVYGKTIRNSYNTDIKTVSFDAGTKNKKKGVVSIDR